MVENSDWICMWAACPHDRPYLDTARYWSAEWRRDSTAGGRVHCAVAVCSAGCLDAWRAAGGPALGNDPDDPWPWRVVEGSYREVVPG